MPNQDTGQNISEILLAWGESDKMDSTRLASKKKAVEQAVAIAYEKARKAKKNSRATKRHVASGAKSIRLIKS